MKKRRQRGFSLLMVVMIIAIMTVVGAVTMSAVGNELTIVGKRRESWSARQIADSGAREMLADTGALLPDFMSPGLSATYTAPSASAVVDSASGSSYSGTYRLLRMVPVSESSESLVRALVYEVDTTSTYRGNDSTSEVRGEIFQTIAIAPGVVPARIHAR